MNKKYLMFGLLGLFAIGLVSAIAYYGFFSATFTVVSAIEVSPCSDTLSTFGGETVIGSPCTITNNAPSERTISIIEDSDDNISVSYRSELNLRKKNLVDWIPYGDTKTINYTVVGKDMIIEGIPTGYTLIYYPNTEGDIFTANVAQAIVLVEGVNSNGNLPITEDVGDDYCGNGDNSDATQCVGAKLWLIKGDSITALAKLTSWTASEFYFETELIQYNVDGNIIMSGTEEGAGASSLTVTPVYKIGTYATGTYNITTTIA